MKLFPFTFLFFLLLSCNEGYSLYNKKIIKLLLKEPDIEVDVLECDKPWESSFDYATILTIDTCYIMYYRTGRHTYCRALSNDGIIWEKQEVKFFNYNGSLENNIITDRVDGVSVEYVNGVYWLFADRVWNDQDKEIKGLAIFRSTDGVNFEKYQNFIVPFFCDSQNEILWDETTHTFKLYLRSWYKAKNPLIDYHHTHKCYRAVSLLEIPSLNYTMDIGQNAFFLNDKEVPSISNELPVVIDNRSISEDFDIYCAYVHKYRDGLYIAYPINYYHTDDKKRGGKLNNDGYATIGFWTSKDGRSFKEIKRDYITNEKKWMEACIGHIETDDCFIHYYIPFSNTHEEIPQKSTIRARIHYKTNRTKK